MKNFKLISVLSTLVFMQLSCFQNHTEVGELESKTITANQDEFSLEPDTTVEGTLRLYYENRLINLPISLQLQDDYYFHKINMEEILKTLEIVEKVMIEGTDLCVVFYRYSVGTQFKRDAQYFRQINGRWALHFDFYWYSELTDPYPFNNGKGLEAKRLLEKINEWEDNADEVWW